MKCSYVWTNSRDEEDDQGSSWESEAEEEKPEELASLYALDDEGEWCWPKRNRITRWSKRVDRRPTFHYIAAGCEGEQMSGGLNQLVHRKAGGA